MRKSIAIFGFLLVALISSAQTEPYIAAIGIRGGYYPSATFKYYTDPDNMIELIVANRWKGYIISGLYEFHREFHNSTLHTTQLNWYFGFGFDAGYFNNTGKYHNPKGNPYPGSVLSLGLDAIIGLEYQFHGPPFAIGVDVRPYYPFYNAGPSVLIPDSPFTVDFAVFVRYLFK